MNAGKKARLFVALLATWLVGVTSLVTAAVFKNPVARATICMGWGLILLWIGGGGFAMLHYRQWVQRQIARWSLGWRWKFIILSVLLALIEEAITTTMTNLAPLFGVPVGAAFITASTNYLDVVTMHSVVVFAPMFVGWQWLLGRWTFTPFQVFLLFGITGTLAESIYGGPQHLGEFGLWIFVYGLMVWLPACCVPAERAARPPRWWHFPLAVIVPFVFIPLVPLPLLARWIDPHHPDIHFPMPHTNPAVIINRWFESYFSIDFFHAWRVMLSLIV